MELGQFNLTEVI